MRAPIFVTDDEDRRLFLEFLGEEAAQQGWRCYAYCLMGNHYHLLIETPEPNLVGGMRRLNGVYTQASIAGTGGSVIFSRGATRASWSTRRATVWSCAAISC